MKLKKIISVILISILIFQFFGTLSIAATEGDSDEEIEFKDENLKKCLLTKIDTNNDGKIQKGELESIETLRLSDNEILDLSGLENAVNLKELSICNFSNNKKIDISAIKTLKKLTSINITMNVFDYESISNLKSLEELTIECGIYDFEIDEFVKIKNLTNLKKLSIGPFYGDDNDELEPFYNELSNFKKLTKLEIEDFNNQFDFNNTKDCKNLIELNITSRGFKNLDKIALLPNLNKLYLSNSNSNDTSIDCSLLTDMKSTELELRNFSAITNLNKLTNLKILTIYNDEYRENNVNIDTLLDEIDTLNLDTIKLDGCYNVYVGGYETGSDAYINFDDISKIFKKVSDSTSKFYSSNKWQNNSNYGSQDEYSTVEIDNENKKIKLNTDTFGNKKAILQLDSYQTKNFCGNLIIKWHNTENADKDSEITIPDENLKKTLLEKYDLDGNKKITEYDLVNLEDIDISNKNISDLTGIEHCINLKKIDADSNNITSLEPVRDLTGMETFYFSCNKITDISPLKNLDSIWGTIANNYITDISALKEFKASNLDCMDFRGNYIRFDDGSENLSTLNELSKNGKINDEWTKNLFMHSQKYGSVGERNDVLNITDSLKNKFIECGIDSNNDKKITKGELNDFNQGDHVGGEELFEPYKMNLSGLNLKSSDINCLKYLSCIDELDLSNNKIQDVSALQYIKHLNTINLSKNNINVSTLNNITANAIDLSYNNLNSIEGISSIKPINCFGGWFAGDGYIKCLKINLSNNNIKDITPINGLLDKLYQIDFSNNEIKNISILKEYNITYDEDADYDNPEYDFSNNYIDINSEETKAIVEKYKNTKIIIKLDNQLTKVEKTDTKTGAIIETNTKVVPENVVLEIDKLDTASETNKNLVKIMNTLPNTTTNTKYEVFNIKLVDNAKKEVQPNGNVTVYLPIPNDYGSKVKIYNIDPTNSKTPYTLLDTSIETIDNKKYAKFKTTHFSYYSMVNSELIGDVNGDGKVNITDVALINSHVKKVKILTGEELSRADVNNDGKVNITDVALVNSHVKKVKLLW